MWKSTLGLVALLGSAAITAVSASEQNDNSLFVETETSTIEYFVEGSGESVVLLPGGGVNVTYMSDLAHSIAGEGFRVIRINPRGAGESKNLSDGASLKDLGDDVAAVIRAQNVGPVHVAGHAFGNRIARMLAAEHPELIKSVILLAAGGKVAPSADVRTAFKTIFSTTASDAEYLQAIALLVGDPNDVEAAGEAVRRARAPQAAGIQFKAAGTAKLEDWWAPEGEFPILVLQGSNDQAAPPENGELLKDDLGDRVTLELISGAGHLMLLTQPERTAAEVIKFLNSSTP